MRNNARFILILSICGMAGGCGSDKASTDLDTVPPVQRQATDATQAGPDAEASSIVELSIAELQRRRSELAEGALLKVTGSISRVAFGEPTKRGPHYAIWLHKHAFGDGVYDVECLFQGPDSLREIVEDQAVTVQGTREKSPFGVKLINCRIIERGDAPEYAARQFDNPIAESKLDFPATPEGISLKPYLPYELKIEAEAILDDGSLPAEYLKAIGESAVVRNVDVRGRIGAEGLKQIAALEGMKQLAISSPRGGDSIDVSKLDFSLLASHPRLRKLSLTSVEGVSDDTLAQIGQWQCLANLALNSARGSISDSGLAGLSKLKSLRRITIPQFRGEIKVTDDGIAALAEAPLLQELQISSKSITGSGLAALNACSNFEVLRLRDSSVTAEGLASLTELSALRFLDLNDTPVSDELAPIIARLAQLEHLNLGETEISDSFFENWGPPPQLVELDVSKTQLTDRGVELLSENSPGKLRSLTLRNYGDKITAASLEFISRIKTLEQLTAPSTFDDAMKKSLRDRGLDVR